MQKSNQARCGEDRDSDTIDRLSDLPDVVLHRILSCVPIKDAVRTSLLSKRWQHLWLFIPKLAFYGHQFRKRPSFMNLVDRALLLRGSFSVEEFILSCAVKSDMVRINSWITCVVMRNVQELSLNIFLRREHVVFPSCLFRCETLTRLEISFGRPHDLIMPSSVCLSSLKDLILGGVRFVDHGSVQNLLLSCPALESLYIDDCHWMDFNGKTISAPNLQRLTIHELLSHGSDVEGCCSGKVVINGPNVKFFNYFSNPEYTYSLVGSSSLYEARLSSPLPMELNFDGFSELIQGLYNVTSLTLSAELFMFSIHGDVFEDLPVFYNMSKLKLDSGHAFLGSKALATLLTKSPCLKVVEISQFDFQEFDPEVSRLVLEPVPPCFESQLKTIVVHCPWPAKVNLDWIGLLLEKATVLEDMILYYVKSKEGSDKLEHLKKLPKGSKDCKFLLLERSKAKRNA